MMSWDGCKNILVIRADNMGDLLMSSPAIRALKDTFGARITLLASAEAAKLAHLLPAIDQVISTNLPWVKMDETIQPEDLTELVRRLKQEVFDACVIFTVYSQSALPAALLAWMSGIPQRLAYCRENPYELLNNWVLEKEPYALIKHQTERDLNLVERVGAVVLDKKIKIKIGAEHKLSLQRKLIEQGIDHRQKIFILHAGVSDEKRTFPLPQWIALAREIQTLFKGQVLFTGSANEHALTSYLKEEVGGYSFALGGEFSIAEFAALLKMAAVVISVNTATIHLAAATGTPQLVLYAQTNPQHHPWMANSKVLEFSIPESSRSSNEVIRFVDKQYYPDYIPLPSVKEIIEAVRELL